MFPLSHCIARHYILSTTGRNRIFTLTPNTLFDRRGLSNRWNSLLALSLRSGITLQNISCEDVIAEMNDNE
jgi:hypothetical protein